MPRARNHTITIATSPARIPLPDGQTPALMPSQNTKIVPATAAAITKLSFSLIDGNESSGRRTSSSLTSIGMRCRHAAFRPAP